MAEAVNALNIGIRELERLKRNEDDLMDLRLRANPGKTEKEIRSELRKEQAVTRRKIRNAYKRVMLWSERSGVQFACPLEKILGNDKQ